MSVVISAVTSRLWSVIGVVAFATSAAANTLIAYPVTLSARDRAQLKALACAPHGAKGTVRYVANRYAKGTDSKIYVSVKCDSSQESNEGNVYCSGLNGQWECDLPQDQDGKR